MYIDYDILRYFAYKNLIPTERLEEFYDDCCCQNMRIEDYLIQKGYCLTLQVLSAMGEFYCLPCSEMEKLDIGIGQCEHQPSFRSDKCKRNPDIRIRKGIVSGKSFHR